MSDQPTPPDVHQAFMRLALDQAHLAAEAGEVPVGAVLVAGGEVIARGFNQPISAHDPTAHAEVVVLRQAASSLANYRLTGTTLYVTVEPCLMCAGAMVHARVSEVVFGAPEPRSGAVVSSARVLETPGLNHRVAVTGGVLAEECRALMQRFFRDRRAQPGL